MKNIHPCYTVAAKKEQQYQMGIFFSPKLGVSGPKMVKQMAQGHIPN